MQRIGGDRAGWDPAGQLVGEQDVGQLGLAVGPCRGIRPLPLGLGVGGDGDHPRRGALLQSVEEQVGEQERRQMVEGEGALQPAGGDVAGVPVPPALLASTSIRGRRWRTSPASRRTSNWADTSAANTSTGPPPAALSSPAASSVLSGSRPQIARSAPHPGQAQGGRPADTGTGAGDQQGPVGHRSAVELSRGGAPWKYAAAGASDGDDDLAASVARFERPHGLGDLTQRVGPADPRGELDGLEQLPPRFAGLPGSPWRPASAGAGP